MRRSILILSTGVALLSAGTALAQNNTPRNLILFVPDGLRGRIVSPQTARETAAGYPGATFWELEGHGHMLLLEPGAEDIARRIAAWIPG